jgi:hypothetical protein
MAKVPTLKDVSAGFASATQLAYNFDAIETAFNNTVSRDGSSPNAMAADLDLNSNDILNAGDITAVNVTVTGTLTGDFDAATVLNGTVAPTTEGSDGDFYIDTVTTTLYGPKATTWPAGVSLVGSGLAAVVNDVTPQLGGTLDANGNTIDMGTYILTDAKVGKLDAIEALADVTDTTNVTAAGALMESEVTNLAQVKAFDTSAYATSAQGTLAANALPKAGGALTGAVTTNSTFDGRDVATDGTKLDAIEALADVTDTTNVTAAGALMDSEVDANLKTFALPASTTISTFGASLVDDASAAAALTTLGAQPLAAVLTNTTASFLLADETKLDAIEALADVTDTTNVVAALTAGTNITIAVDGTISATDTNTTYSVGDGGLTQVNFTTADNTKLDAIEALADVTDTTNVTAAGALMDSEVSANLKTLVLPASTTISAFGATLVDDANAAAAATTLGLGTGDSPQFTAVNVGAASDTTITRTGAGVIAVEGVEVTTNTATQTLTNKTLTAVALDGSITEEVFTLPSSTTPELDPADGTVQKWTLTGNSTPTEVFADGESITLMIDDGTASTITWPAMTWVNNAGAAPTLATTGFTTVALWHFGTLYGALVGDGT